MSKPLGLLELADDHGYLTLRDVDLGIDWSKRGIHHNGWERTLSPANMMGPSSRQCDGTTWRGSPASAW
jgi:hypothetical protein